jgi:hypothetical protein
MPNKPNNPNNRDDCSRSRDLTGSLDQIFEDYNGHLIGDGSLRDEQFRIRIEREWTEIVHMCAQCVETQKRGTRYQWESGSHFGTMTREMANRIRSEFLANNED